MKNRQDMCLAKDAGYTEYPGLTDRMKTGCLATPAFKARYCNQQTNCVCTSNEGKSHKTTHYQHPETKLFLKYCWRRQQGPQCTTSYICTMGFKVYGICTRGQLYVFPRAKPERRHTTARGYKSHTPLKPMVQMTCAIVAFIVPANCFTVLRRSHSCPATLMYPRVHRCTLA